MIGQRVRPGLAPPVQLALLGEVLGTEFVVTSEVQATALRLWCGDGWAGDPLEPSAAGPMGPEDELVLMARDVAVIAASPGPFNTPINWHGRRMRARAALAAGRDPAPVQMRSGLSRADVEVVSRALPYAAYFDTEDIRLRHRTFDGGMSAELDRACFRAGDAVTVLPYDPVSDRVLLIEQFRPACFVRGDPVPWVLEPVAGRCDGDEPLEVVARREAQEEAGLDLTHLERIAAYYPSPGVTTEYLTSFVGLCDLSGASAETGFGLASEGEDIRTIVLGFEDAFGLVASGEADAGPLILSLLWLARERDRLRAL